MIDGYVKAGDLVNAKTMFDEMPERNVISYTTMIDGYAKAGDLVNAKTMFDEMSERDVIFYTTMIDGYAKVGNMVNAKIMFDEMPKRNVISYNKMIDGYAKAGNMASALFMFEKAPERNSLLWSAMILGYGQNGQPYKAIKMFVRMLEMGIKPHKFILVSLMPACSQLGSFELAKWVDCYLSRSDIDVSEVHVLAARIDMYAKCGDIDTASKLFEEMPKRDVITNRSFIQGLAIHGQQPQAIEIFDRMINEGLVPDEIALTIVLNACSGCGLVEEGLHYFNIMKNKYSIVPTPDHCACIVGLLSRTGWLKAAYDLLKSMPVEPHVVAWGALLGACKLHCDVELGELAAAKLFEIQPLNAANYVLFCNIYADAEQRMNASRVMDKMKEQGLRKIHGCSWTYI